MIDFRSCMSSLDNVRDFVINRINMYNSLRIKQNTSSKHDIEDSLYCMPKPGSKQ